MNISMLAYSEIGGAGRAVVRLMDGLNRLQDVHAEMIVKKKATTHPSVIQIEKRNPLIDYITKRFFIENVPKEHVLCSMMYSGTEKQYLALLNGTDLIHLHWIANFVSIESLAYLDQAGIPLVWTFHDRNPMTGGCHCTYGCEKYQQECDSCPELLDNPYNITKGILSLKKNFLPKNLVVVTPSQWMADCARKSTVFRHHRIEVIPNSVDIDVFSPMDKNEAKARFYIPSDRKVILYCSEAPEQIHKGYRFFREAMWYAKENIALRHLFAKKQVELLLIGNTDAIMDDMIALDVPFQTLGYVKNDDLLSAAYSAADVTVLPSLEDNFPNVMLESLACGTPVAGFQTGGIPDVVKKDKTGLIVDQKDSVSLGQAIATIVLGKENLSAHCRRYAEKYLSQRIQVTRYKALYDDIVSQNRTIKHRTNTNKVKFAFPEETHQLLAPYYFKAIDHISCMGDRQLIDFMNERPLEDAVLENARKFAGELLTYPKKSLAIWGKGAFAKRFLEMIIATHPSVKDRVVGFFDNSANEGEYLGFPVLEKKHISQLGIRGIIIGSVKYEDEIYAQIKGLRDEKIKIIRLYDCYKKDSS